MIAVTVRTVKAGEKVGENYGPLFQETEREERRRSLEKQYWFHCTCDACTLEWPTMSEMNNLQDIKLRCSNKKCDNAMNIDPNAGHFMIKCNVCSQNVNMFKPLKALQVMMTLKCNKNLLELTNKSVFKRCTKWAIRTVLF